MNQVNPIRERPKSARRTTPPINTSQSRGFPDARTTSIPLNKALPSVLQQQPSGADDDPDALQPSADSLFAAMTPTEIEQALAEIHSHTDPAFLRGLEKLKQKAAAQPQKKSVTFLDEKLLIPTQTPEDVERVIRAHPLSEQAAKLAWIYAPEPNEEDAGSHPSLVSTRFDLAGKPADPSSLSNKLYHHGDEPSKPGYTFAELAHLSRSTYPSQRVAALKAMAGALRDRAAILARDGTDPIYEHPRGAALVAARVALDVSDAHQATLVAALDCMHAYCIEPQALEDRLGLSRLPRCHWGCTGMAQGSLAGARAREPATDPEEPPEDDAAMAEMSPARFLASSLFLERAAFVFDALPPASAVQAIQLVEYLARARPDAVARQESFWLVFERQLLPTADVRVTESALWCLQTLAAQSRPCAELVHARALPTAIGLALFGPDASASRALDLWRDLLLGYGLGADQVEPMGPELTRLVRQHENQRSREAAMFLLAEFCAWRNDWPLAIFVEACQEAARLTATRFSVAAASLAGRFCAGPSGEVELGRVLAELVCEEDERKKTTTAEASFEDLAEMCSRALQVFAGFALFQQDDSCETLLALEVAATGLRHCQGCEDLAAQLWDRAEALAPVRASTRRPPQAPRLGCAMALGDALWERALLLLREQGLGLPVARLRRALVRFVGERALLGPRGSERRCVEAARGLLSCTLLRGMSSREALGIREALLGELEALMLKEPEQPGIAWARSDAGYLVWQRAGSAWPGMLLLSGRADGSERVARASLRLCWELREEVGASELVGLLMEWTRGGWAVRLEQALALWDWAAHRAHPARVVAWLGGAEAARGLAGVLATVYEQWAPGHELAAACLGWILCKADKKLQLARQVVLKELERGSGGRLLQWPEADVEEDGLEEDDALVLYANLMACGKLEGHEPVYQLCAKRVAARAAKKLGWGVQLALDKLSSEQRVDVLSKR